MKEIKLTEDDVKLLIATGDPLRAYAPSQDPTAKGSTIPLSTSVMKYPLPVSSVKACDDVLNHDQSKEWKD